MDMSLKDLQLEREYRSFQSDIVNEFYIPALKNAVLYQRAVGFFSSSALNLISNGINEICKNNGKIQIIASPKLSEDDIDEIKKGYAERKIIEQALIREISEPKTKDEERNLSFIAKLIAENYLDIKIALVTSKSQIAMYHEKVGIISDIEGNSIAFSGSMNESENAFFDNYESFDVFCSWTSDNERVEDKKRSFNSIWNDYEPGVKTITFPNAAKQRLLYYYKNIHQDALNYNRETEPSKESKDFFLPENLEIREYQETAIKKWEENKFVGIFDMATGTGKTLTALASAEHLYRANKNRLAIIIVVPYQHLVTQWMEDLTLFGLDPIVGYSASPQKHWKKRLNDDIIAFNLNIKNCLCFITTNATFCSKYIKSEIEKLENDTLIIVDEAHNMGAINARNYLPENVQYRLALSATIDRHNDEIGTDILYKYFQKKCIIYSLSDAINNGYLTEYYYYPTIVTLNSNELDNYISISNQIAKSIKKKNNKVILTESARSLLIKRSRIVAGAIDKIDKLKKEILPYKDKNHILVYCGTANLSDDNSSQDIENEISQIDYVCEILGNEIEMRVGRFTSKETVNEREIIKEKFSKGDMLQVLVAIKCLDEGVNIPSIETAFILASSTNPKEYIQRRGRVLRKYPGKKYAEIYDFVTLPCAIEDVDNMPEKILKSSKGLVKNEIIRMLDFYENSENPSHTNELILKLKYTFGITEKELKGENEYAI